MVHYKKKTMLKFILFYYNNASLQCFHNNNFSLQQRLLRFITTMVHYNNTSLQYSMLQYKHASLQQCFITTTHHHNNASLQQHIITPMLHFITTMTSLQPHFITTMLHFITATLDFVKTTLRYNNGASLQQFITKICFITEHASGFITILQHAYLQHASLQHASLQHALLQHASGFIITASYIQLAYVTTCFHYNMPHYNTLHCFITTSRQRVY